MSLEKTLTDQYRLPLKLDNFPVSEALPSHFESVYPKFVEFIKKYYDYYDDENSPAKFLNEMQHNRDMEDVTPQLLRLIAEELFLGKDYSESFSDKKSAIQISNLLYRSKGTPFSIEQFFRMFFGFDVDIRYGRNEIFAVGDPLQEKLLYTTEIRSLGKDVEGNNVTTIWPGKRLKFNFSDGQIDVYALAITPRVDILPSLYIQETSNIFYINDVGFVPYIVRTKKVLVYNVWYQLRENIDYYVDYDNKSIVFLKPGIENSLKPLDPWLDHLATYGEISPPDFARDRDGNPTGPLRYAQARIETNRRFPAGSPIGPDIGDKKITDNAYYQVFSILIKTPIAVKSWKNVYKDFIHPSGVYLDGEVLLESLKTLKLSSQPTSTERYEIEVEGTGSFSDEVYSEVTELTTRVKVVVPEPSVFVYSVNNANLELPVPWDGSSNNSRVAIRFNKKAIGTGDQWLLSATVGGKKFGFVFPAATPNKLVYRYVEGGTLSLEDLDIQQDVLLGKTYNISILSTETGSAAQIFTSSNATSSVYSINLEYQPRIEFIGDNFEGDIWGAYFTDPVNRQNTVQYPMREGSGDTFHAYRDTRLEFKSKDIGIRNGVWSLPNISVWRGNNISIPLWTSTSSSGFKMKMDFQSPSVLPASARLMWNNAQTDRGLSIENEILTYKYQASSGIVTFEILSVSPNTTFNISIEHGVSEVTAYVTINNAQYVTIVSSTAPSQPVSVNYVIAAAMQSAVVWNLELIDGSNTRYYPIQEGDGETVFAYDADSNIIGSSEDATLQGAGDWVNLNYFKYGEE
jgi:hypothetical protein